MIASDEIAARQPAVIGQECHVIALAPDGPRGREGPRVNLDGYENLILLCANCHALIDVKPDLFPRNELLRIKKEHEERVARRSQEPIRPRLKVADRNEQVRLERMDDGDQLIRVLSNSLSHTHETPRGLSGPQLELIGDCLQEAFDWSEILDEIGSKGHFDAAQNLQDLLEQLRQEGLIIYAGYRRMELSGGIGLPEPWLNAIVKVAREEEVQQPADTAAASA